MHTFISWYAGFDTAFFGLMQRDYERCIVQQAEEEFERDWRSMFTGGDSEITEWVNRNYEQIEEWALDYLIHIGY